MQNLTLTKKEVVELAKPYTFTSKQLATWASLSPALEALPLGVKEKILEASAAKEAERLAKRKGASSKSVDKEAAERGIPHGPTDDFMRPVSEDTLRQRISLYIEATSNAALEYYTCFICARRMNYRSGTKRPLKSLRNLHHLTPVNEVRGHQLWNGYLVERSAILDSSRLDTASSFVCTECDQALDKDQLPKHSLANDLWIGPTPFELKILTIPEQLLLSRYHPRCYVFKLFSHSGYAEDEDKRQLGIRGNVTLYEMPTNDIVKMVEGQLLPSSPHILASLISVTFVGSRRLPKNWLQSTFRVRRPVLGRALVWLKEWNRIFEDAKIDYEALSKLPEDGVPTEIEALIRHDSDDSAATREAENYAADPSLPDDLINQNHDLEYMRCDKGDVIPLHFNGVSDTDLSTISASDLMRQAIENSDGSEPGYAVRHSGQAISTFGEERPGYATAVHNPLMAAFPVLWPYGVGGIESKRRIKISFNDHVKWCLQHFDNRFGTHHSFPFVAFGIEQRRQALLQAKIQMRRADFDRDSNALNRITLADLRVAEEEERSGKSISNPDVRTLQKHVFSTSGRVMGSNNSRIKYRGDIWGSCLRLGPPSLWVTINPADVHDPVMQIIAGEKIDMDAFLATAGPDKDQRARNVAKDPYSAATYFHFIMTTAIECLFGVKCTKFRVESETGIFGRVSGYYVVVEAQGRGSLHGHIFIWFHGAPNAKEIEEMLATGSFREKVAAYMQSTMRAHVDGLTPENIKTIPKEPELAYSRPPNPNSPTWNKEVADKEKQLVRAIQLHECNASCKTENKFSGARECKRRAPWPLSEQNSISKDGEVLIRRLCGFICSYSPGILLSMACNNNIQLLVGGKQTKDSMWYLTDYTTKKQKRGFNNSALLAKAFLFHDTDSSYLNDLRQRNRLFVFRCSNTLNQQMELSGQQVITYLMGWGDTFRSHIYVPLYWSSLAYHVKQLLSTEEQTDEQSEEANVMIIFNSKGCLRRQSQVFDYMLRPPCFESMSFLDYTINTFEMANNGSIVDEGEPPSSVNRKRGRPANLRGKYLEEHAKTDTHIRVIRSRYHNCLPSIVGPWFPRPGEDEGGNDFYCASMLSLLRPWRKLEDLRPDPSSSWQSGLTDLKALCYKNGGDRDGSLESTQSWPPPFCISDVLSAVEFYYDARQLATERRSSDKVGSDSPALQTSEDDDEEAEERHDEDAAEESDNEEDEEEKVEGNAGDELPVGSESDLQHLQSSLIPYRESVHANEALVIARASGVLPSASLGDWDLRPQQLRNADEQDLNNLHLWAQRMEEEVAKINDDIAPLIVSDEADTDVPPRSLDTHSNSFIHGEVVSLADLSTQTGGAEGSTSRDPKNSPSPQLPLNDAQRRAFNILAYHLDSALQGRQLPQLLMTIYGEGGTGKSRVIQAVTDYFESRGVISMMSRGAFTGAAATVINGKTLHVLAGLPLQGDSISPRRRQMLHKFWSTKQFLIIDEMSMISRRLFAKVSRFISSAVANSDPSIPFGGKHVLLAGDFHQFPPVVSKRAAPLYYPVNSAKDSADDSLGRLLYEQFETVVILREQNRVSDPVWADLLSRARHGSCQQTHLQLLRSLILTNSGDNPNFLQPPWDDAILITPRHQVRVQWNQAAAERYCEQNNQRLLICPANDTIRKRPLNFQERHSIATSTKKGRNKPGEHGRLQDYVQLAIGLKIMVTWNIQTDIDIANGSRGVITDIVLNENEPPLPEDHPIVYLSTVPKYILVKLERSKLPPIGALPQGTIPITPIQRSYTFTFTDRPVSIQRTQLPITLAYALTDIRSQGQTIPCLIADIGKVPSGPPLTPFNAYVTLSRAPSRASIRLLRDFDDNLFTQHPSEYLREEDHRLEELDKITADRYRFLDN